MQLIHLSRESYEPREEVIKISYCWAKHFVSIHNEAQHSSDRSKSSTCVYLNTDGTVHYNYDFSAIREEIRDEKWTWILGYNRFLERRTIAIAEL